MPTERSDVVYGYWREASDKFDYFVAGVTGALVAYLGQNLKPVRIGANPSSLELLAMLLLLGATIMAFKRIETNIQLFKVMHRRLYAEESRGTLIEAALKGPGLNASTGDVFTPAQMLSQASTHAVETKVIARVLDDLASETSRYYTWRNRLLLNGFAVLVFARVLPAYIA